jgi:hypothetical protein
VDPVETARSRDIPASIEVRSKTFNNLQDSLKSGFIPTLLEPGACTMVGRDVRERSSVLGLHLGVDGSKSGITVGLISQFLELLSAIFTRCLQNSDIMNIDALKQFNLTLPPISMSEDCLYLSIYSPAHAHEDFNLPVSARSW